MESSDRTLRLQQVADYRTVRTTLRVSAIVSLAIGAFTALAALLPPPDPILGALGAMLVAAGLWNLARPRPTGILVDGASVIVVGLYNILGTALALSAGSAGAGAAVWTKVGLVQLIVGAQSLWRYRRYRHAFAAAPTEAERHEMDAVVSVLWKGRVRDREDAIEFVLRGLGTTRWRARLEDDLAILVADRGRDVRVVNRRDLDVEEHGKVLIGSSLQATFALGDRTFKGTIPPESLERFRRWKTGVSLPRAVAA